MELVYISVYRMYRIITILLFFLPAIAAGQIPVIFQHLNSAHGLSDNNVNAIVSDKNGFLWVGTDKGLNVYDGKSVSLFAKPNSGSLVDEEITALFCDSFNRVWVGTPAGVVLIDEKRQMKKVELSDTFKNYSVKEILYTQSLGIIIFSNKGNFFLNTKSKRWEKIPFFSQQQFKNRAVDISSFSPNQILMCDEFESILLVDFVQKKELWRLPVKYIVTAARLNDSTILASTFTGIIYFINSHTQKILSIKDFPKRGNILIITFLYISYSFFPVRLYAPLFLKTSAYRILSVCSSLKKLGYKYLQKFQFRYNTCNC